MASPLVIQNTIDVGATYQVTEDFSVSAVYGHAFQHSINGPLMLPGGSVPGTSITTLASGDLFLFGLTVRFGRPRGPRPPPPPPVEEILE